MKGEIMRKHRKLYPKLELVSLDSGDSVDLPLCPCVVDYKPLCICDLDIKPSDPFCGIVKTCNYVSTCSCEFFKMCTCDSDFTPKYCTVHTNCKFEVPMSGQLPEGCETHVACDSDRVEVHVTKVRDGQKTEQVEVLHPKVEHS